jgi:vacuolar-type H+-ATPase subunit H
MQIEPRAKWARGVGQAVEHLICKHEALSSNPSPTKERKEKKTILPERKEGREILKKERKKGRKERREILKKGRKEGRKKAKERKRERDFPCG